MKITEKNAKFAIVRTAFHGGGAASFHNSLEAAERALKKEILKSCQCGCAAIVPITTAAREEGEKEVNSMTKLIQQRINELLKSEAIHNKMLHLRATGATPEQVRAWLVKVAIGTLYGIGV